MKSLTVLSLLFSTLAQAATPALYCVSTKTFEPQGSWPVNQINIFTTAKGTLMMNLQYHAWGQEEGEDANITTAKLLKLRGLTYNSATKTLSTPAGKFVLKLENEISEETAKATLDNKKTSFDFIDPPGFQVEFKKYQLATLTAFQYPGKPGEWSEILSKAISSGVNQFICGDAKRMKKAVQAKVDSADD